MLQRFAKRKGRRHLSCAAELDTVMMCMSQGENRQKCRDVIKDLKVCLGQQPTSKGHKPTINYHLHRLARSKFKR